MKINIYTLLGMVKDGKAPNKIKYREMIYHINYEYGDYESDIEEYRFADVKGHYYLFEDIDMFKCLDDKIEILEEEKKIPEKIRHDACWIYDDETNQLEKITLKDDLILNKLDDIIDYLDYLKSKGE